MTRISDFCSFNSDVLKSLATEMDRNIKKPLYRSF